MFGCGGAEDSIEHYSTCRRLHPVAAADLDLPWAATPGERLAAFLGLDLRPGSCPQQAVRVGIRMHATYKVHCLCRHGQVRCGDDAVAALRQACREAVRGHHGAEKIYDAAHAWAHPL